MKTGIWFIVLLTAGMIASVAYSSHNAVCIPEYSLTEPQGDNTQIWIQDNAFSPASIYVPAGTTVHWTNMDGSLHTVTSDTGLFDSKNLGKGSSFSYTFSAKGSYKYHCSIHTFMTGTIIVE